MRALVWHCERFASRVTKRGRSLLAEEPASPTVEARDCALCLVAAEAEDEGRVDEVASAFVAFAREHAANIGVRTFVLLPFSHLFVEPSRPETALELLKRMEAGLRGEGFEALRIPFGWFNELEIVAKGHPVSRVARRF